MLFVYILVLCVADFGTYGKSLCRYERHCVHGNWHGVLGDIGVCSCNVGYTGDCCEHDKDECSSNPCQHGSCHDGVNKYTCTCSSGYTGSNCQSEINECNSNPCQHGGRCHDYHGRFTCSCLPGYTGVLCQKNIDECASHPCQHGGRCIDHVNSYTCTCRPVYTGSRCETVVSKCSSHPCQNGGVCSDLVDRYSCSCKSGYTGNNCEIDIDDCASDPCVYGVCHDSLNGYTCTCRAGFTGTQCEGEIDECASKPCQNGATCVDLFNGYRCECFEGDSGSDCEIASQHSYSPQITLKEQIMVNEGAVELHIPCTVEGLPAPTVRWEAVNARLQSNVKQIGHFLVLDNVTLADTGYYTCIATNRVGSDAKVTHVIVTAIDSKPYVAPMITAHSIMTVNYHSEAILKCNVTGYPTPRVRWEYKQNIPGIQINGASLRIPNVTSEASGIYTCIATNDIGSSRANIMLETKYDSPKITQGPQVYTGSAGQAHNFTCLATGHPQPKITWTFTSFSHEPLTLPQHDEYNSAEILELHNIQRSGILVCSVGNEFGTDTASAHIIAHNSNIFG